MLQRLHCKYYPDMKNTLYIAVPVLLLLSASCGPSTYVPVDRSKEEAYIGFGTSPKNNLAFTVSEVKSTQADEDMFDNIFDYLRNKVPGVEVSNTVYAGEVPHIQIRGRRMINEDAQGEPLFLVDGVEYPDISVLLPREVYSVQVLKDAAASAYGSRGANGVIMFTTKVAHEAELNRAAQAKEERQARRSARKNN